MKIYKISQDVNTDYDTYDAAIVCAENEDEARLINPNEKWNDTYTTWAKTPDQVTVIEIGNANENQKKGIILASFNAG